MQAQIRIVCFPNYKTSTTNYEIWLYAILTCHLDLKMSFCEKSTFFTDFNVREWQPIFSSPIVLWYKAMIVKLKLFAVQSTDYSSFLYNIFCIIFFLVICKFQRQISRYCLEHALKNNKLIMHVTYSWI